MEEGVRGRQHHGGLSRPWPLGQRQPVQQGTRQTGRPASHLVCAQVNLIQMKCSKKELSRYVKDPKMTPKRKELLIYMLERIGREDGGKLTIIFDCQSAGVRFLANKRRSILIPKCCQECGDRGNPVHHAGEKSCG